MVGKTMAVGMSGSRMADSRVLIADRDSAAVSKTDESIDGAFD